MPREYAWMPSRKTWASPQNVACASRTVRLASCWTVSVHSAKLFRGLTNQAKGPSAGTVPCGSLNAHRLAEQWPNEYLANTNFLSGHAPPSSTNSANVQPSMAANSSSIFAVSMAGKIQVCRVKECVCLLEHQERRTSDQAVSPFEPSAPPPPPAASGGISCRSC